MLILLLLEFTLSIYRTDHALSISFAAPWSPVRIVDQMFSFLLQYSNEAAKTFLYNVTSNKGEKINDEKYLWDVAKNILPSTYYSIMKANVDFGSTIPSSIFNGFNSSSYTKEINFPSTQKFQTDFVSYGKSDNINEAYNNIIYADIQNESEHIHNLLDDEVPFVLRSTPISTGNKSKVRGYGIELRPFKYSMEYNVKNRAENNDDSQSTINITDETTLRLPSEFEENLTSLSYENIESKFSTYLKENSDKKNYTKLLRDITNNWPLYLKSITETNPDSEYTNELHSYIDPRFKQSYLNGRHFSVDHSDSFTFLQMINEEQNLNEILRSEFNYTESQIEWFTTTRLIDQKIHFFDFRSEFINFYNDIEKDDKYKNWPTDVKILSNYRKVIPRLRKNVINAVLYFDPTTIDGMNEFLSLLFLTMNMYPITAGIIPIFRMNDQLSRKVGFAYHHLTLNNPKEGMNFLIRTYNYIEKDKETGAILRITEEAFAKAYSEIKSTKKNKKKWSDLNELYTQNSIEYKTIQKVARYYAEKNLKIDTVSINGMIYTAPSNANNYMEFIFKSLSLIVPIFMNFKNDKKVMSNHVIDTIIEEGSHPVTDKIDTKIFTDEIDSLDVHSLSHKDQIHFLNELNEIEWYNLNQNDNKNNDDDDHSLVNTYAIILSGSHLNESLSFDEEGFTVLDEFIQKQNKKETKSQILFAVDPTSSELLNSRLLSFIPITSYPLLIINGRIIQKFNYTDINEYLQADTWNYDYVIKNYKHSIRSKVGEKTEKNKDKLLNFYLATISNSWRGSQIQRGFINVFMIANQNPLRFTKNVEGALELTLIINPFKRNFQRFCGLIEYMESHEILSFNMILNPSFSESDDMQTLSSFYRSSTNNDDVVFTHLNDHTTYSSLIDVPNSWQAESLSALFDLDNILLSELAPKVHTAEYVLTNIIVEGSCKTVDGFPASGWPLSIQPPNSLLPIELKSRDYYNENYACKSDTIVMEPQNGYFQLMGTIGPNVISYSKSGDSKSGIFVEVNGFALKKTKIVLNGVKKSDLKTKDKNENKLYTNSSRIDVFGVASGHLYERLIKIMMLSVKRHTEPRTDVTFWLLNNFLSPQFKSVLPQMAAKYEFKYKLVKYKWPSWIYPQFEKQRIIWGNKILFLDVLFPLDLNRVIYVDSDQIVRTDLTELMKMDFENAPYAFTPFCDSRIETEPYRFWKKGFWKTQLQEMAYVYQKDGKVPKPLKYHISALFAIDLNRFRQLNGGDALRLYYNSLAPDKQSLANLDQDLPNYAQNILKIFSLPQEWLWCETWCSDDSMDKAKTIDLCNNPLTKKPKLEIAQTRVKEWPGLDKEVSEILAPRDEYEKMFFK